jgi:hypothetical protein
MKKKIHHWISSKLLSAVLSDTVIIQNKSHHYFNPVAIGVEDNTFVITVAGGAGFAHNPEPIDP